jgi:streptogrisin D
VDLATNRVIVSYDDTVTGSRLTTLQTATQRFGAAVQLRCLPGNLKPVDSRTVGGNAVIGPSGYACSLGFNTIRSGVYYFITAGHCTNTSPYWYDNDNTSYLGYRTNSYYDGMDYGIVKYTNTSIAKYGAVDLYNGTYQDITTSRRALQNEYVCRSGRVTAVRRGYVLNNCATVTYDDGVTLYCMIKTSACANEGDSGGPLWSGVAALGVLSGGDSNCSTHPNGPTYFMPV